LRINYNKISAVYWMGLIISIAEVVHVGILTEIYNGLFSKLLHGR
jgi:hypothetical protein